MTEQWRWDGAMGKRTESLLELVPVCSDVTIPHAKGEQVFCPLFPLGLRMLAPRDVAS